MGGVTTLVGEYDGTKQAAVMVDGLDDTPLGPLFLGPDAYEQVEAFLDWLRRLGFISHAEEIGLDHGDIPAPGSGDGDDPRQWPAGGLAKVVRYWKREHLDGDGFLREEG